MAAELTHRHLATSHVRSEVDSSAPLRRQGEVQRLAFSVGNAGMQRLLGGVRGLIGVGAALPPGLRSEHERRFGTDLADVRVHDHAEAHLLAHGQRARAFTLGSDIVFNRGFYRPGTQAGQGLIAHELAHVVQQRASGIARPGGAAHEAAADAVAHAATNGVTGRVAAGPAAVRGVQCDPLTAAEIARLDQDQLRARLRANEQEAVAMVYTDDYKASLQAENLELKRHVQTHASVQPAAAQPAAAAPDPEVTRFVASIDSELAELKPLVTRYYTGMLLEPADYALTAVRNLDERIRADIRALSGAEALVGSMAGRVREAIASLQALQPLITPTLAIATAWHDANPMGESLGEGNDRAGTWLAGVGAEQWEKGGLHVVPSALAYLGALNVAVLDSTEKLASMGFHDVATEVSKAYARGDISWNEAKDILWGAAGRAILIAAVTRGAGMAASRIGVMGAEAAGLTTSTVRYGVVAGTTQGALTTAAALGTQALTTKALQGAFDSRTGKAIWNQGMPKGKDWAIAIPVGMLMGGLGGMRGVELANDKLVGTIIDTPMGPSKVVAVTKLQLTASQGRLGVTTPGMMVLEPVGATSAALPPPPVVDVVLTFDPATQSWVSSETPTTALTRVPSSGNAAPAGGGALARAAPAQVAPVASGFAGRSLAGASAQALTGALPKPALPTSKPAPRPLNLLQPGPRPFGLLTPPEPPSWLTLAPDARAVPGTPGAVVGGSSQALGKNLLETYGLARRQKFSGWQPHHLIPTEAASHPVILKIGMNLDHPTNGIMLPEPGVGWSGRLPTHQGYHSLFSNVALAELDKIDVTLPVPQLQLKVFGLQMRLRLGVEAGLPLYYSKGGTEAAWQQSIDLPVPR